jgi:hypothetical protein
VRFRLKQREEWCRIEVEVVQSREDRSVKKTLLERLREGIEGVCGRAREDELKRRERERRWR